MKIKYKGNKWIVKYVPINNIKYSVNFKFKQIDIKYYSKFRLLS